MGSLKTAWIPVICQGRTRDTPRRSGCISCYQRARGTPRPSARWCRRRCCHSSPANHSPPESAGSGSPSWGSPPRYRGSCRCRGSAPRPTPRRGGVCSGRRRRCRGKSARRCLHPSGSTPSRRSSAVSCGLPGDDHRLTELDLNEDCRTDAVGAVGRRRGHISHGRGGGVDDDVLAQAPSEPGRALRRQGQVGIVALPRPVIEPPGAQMQGPRCLIRPGRWRSWPAATV